MKQRRSGLTEWQGRLNVLGEMGSRGEQVSGSCRWLMTRGPEEVKRTWYEHFSRVLNIPSQYNQAVLNKMTSLALALKLDHPPTLEELIAPLSRLKRGKVGGRTGILPELVLYEGPELLERLLLLMDDIWRGGEVVKDWQHARERQSQEV